jgi:hypothetical protein
VFIFVVKNPIKRAAHFSPHPAARSPPAQQVYVCRIVVSTRVSSTPQYVDAVTLISLKLDAHLSDPIRRSKDLTAVVELLKTAKYGKDLPVHPAVQAEYLRVWAGLFEKP